MALEPVIVADGGLDLISPRQSTSPGALIECENFERANRVGYQKIQGIRSYSGGCVFDVTDPLILWRNDLTSEGNLTSYQPLVDTVTWGSGGFFDSRTGTVPTHSGRGVVTYSYDDAFTNQNTFALVGAELRLPEINDILDDGVNTNTVQSTILQASNMTSIPNVPGFTALNTYFMLATMGRYFDKTFSTLTYPGGRKTGGSYIFASMLGYTCGGFYWKDKLHVITDLEKWSFTGGNAEPSLGDEIRVYKNGVAPTGDYHQAVVEKIVLTSGTWAGANAAGYIYFSAYTGSGIGRANLFSVKVPTGCRNQTTTVNNPLTLTTRARSDIAAMWRDTGVYTLADAWERCELGHEIQFNLGDNKFKVLSRANRDESLNSAYVSVPSSSSWASATVIASSTNWVNDTNVFADDGTVASYTLTGSGESDNLDVVGFTSISIPTNAIVLGVEVIINRRNSTPFNVVSDSYVGLVGVPDGGQNKSKADLWPIALASVTYGGERDTWGFALTPDIINSPNFGVRLRYRQQPRINAPYTTEVDSIRIRVHYKDPTSKVVIRSRTTASQNLTSITRVGTVATVTKVAHGYNNGESVTITGADQAAYNGVKVIYNVTANTFDYDVSGAPVTPATTATVITGQLIGVDVCVGKAVWYYKNKGVWNGSSKAEGILTVTELSSPDSVLAGMEIRDDINGGGILNAITTSGANKISLPSSSALEANGSKYNFIITNFYGNQDAEQVIGVSGCDYAFSWDGRYLIKIHTGLDPNLDKPRHIERHIDQLALGYYSGSVTLSDQGYPESFAGRIDGSSPPSEDPDTFPGFIPSATNNPTGEPVYGLAESSNRTLIVGCRSSVRSIIGGGFSIAQEVLSSESGIVEYTMKVLNGQPLFINHRGLQTVESINSNQSLTEFVSPFLIQRIQATNGSLGQLSGIELVELVRHKNQYRIYFRDRSVLTVTLTDRGPMCTTQRLPFTPKWTATGTTLSGKDRIFCGTYAPASTTFENDLLMAAHAADISAGTSPTQYAIYGPNIYPGVYVYEMDVGYTWDDRLPINAFMTMNVGHLGTEIVVKHFDRMLVSGLCYGFANFGVKYGLNYGDIETSTVNVNAGNAAGSPLLAFSEQSFSREVPIRRDGYALSVRVVSDGSNAYGDQTMSAQSTPFYIRPFSIQALTIITEQQRVRRA